jgi:hypothetical protein
LNIFPYIGPYGKNVSKHFSETTWTIETKLLMNDHWKVLYIFSVFMPNLNIFPYYPMLVYVLRWRPSWISDRHIKQKLGKRYSNDHSLTVWVDRGKRLPFISSPGPKVQVNYCHQLASGVCRSSSINFSHFKLLPRNHWANWNQT